MTESEHELPCVFLDVLDLCPPGCFDESDRFVDKKFKIFSSASRTTQPCRTHPGCNCIVPGSDYDVSGLPCVDNSKAKKGRLFEEGPFGPVFIVWALRLRRYRIPLAVLENVEDLKISVVIELLSDMFYIFPIYVDMEDVGHSGVSRRRVYTVVALKDAVDIIRNPVQLYGQVVEFLHGMTELWGGGTVPCDYLTADTTEIQLDAMEVARTTGKLFRSNITDLSYLLSENETAYVEGYSEAYEARFPGQKPDRKSVV